MEKGKAADFNKNVKELFFPIYPLLADEFLKRSGVKEGVCLDAGAGNGYMGLAIAEKSNLRVELIDIDDEMLGFAQENIKERNLEEQVKTLNANVQDLPYPDNYAALIVSRGSIFFWKDQAKGLSEIYRVLLPGGMAFIGGGFVTEELLAEMTSKMSEKSQDWESHINERIGPGASERFWQVLKNTDIPETNVYIHHDQANLWIIMRK